MTIATVVPWVVLTLGVSAGFAALRDWRAGRGKSQPAVAAAICLMLAVSMVTTGWVRAAAWVVLGVSGVLATVPLFRERTFSGLLVAMPFYAMILAIAVIEVIVDHISPWQRAMFATVAVFVAAALASMTVHLVQHFRSRHA